MINGKRNVSRKIGQPPGTLVHVGEQRTSPVTISVIAYDKDHVTERTNLSIGEAAAPREEDRISWINVTGVHNPTVIGDLGEYFGIHPLVQEDILNTTQRPKLEDFESYLFLVIKMLYQAPDTGGITIEQVSLIIGDTYVLSFQELPGDVFDSIRERIRTGRGRVRRMGADYLAYTLLDAVVDNYYIVLGSIGDLMDTLEEELFSNPSTSMLQKLHEIKSEVLTVRRAVWPLREVAGALERGESSLIDKTSRIYFRDVQDHTIQVVDAVESLRDIIGGMLDVYLSSVSNRMNEIMKTLTIFAAIFIPLTFMAGVYGMNFQYMPELGWRWGYPSALGIMAAAGLGMFVFFRTRKWM